MDESGGGASFASYSIPLPVETNCHSLRNKEIVAFLYCDSKLQVFHNSREAGTMQITNVSPNAVQTNY